MNKTLFGRGYAELNKKLERGSKYTMSCFNCEHYYQAPGDQEEVCQNQDVLKYDMMFTENSIYCSKWKYCSIDIPQQSVKSIFKKRKR
jgi:hypothetical protein